MMEPASYFLITNALGELFSIASFAVSDLNAIPTILTNTSIPTSLAGQAAVLSQRATAVGDTVTLKHVDVSPSLNALVVALQTMVVDAFGSVDDYLLANDLLVSNDFATLSGACNFSISSFNVQT